MSAVVSSLAMRSKNEPAVAGLLGRALSDDNLPAIAYYTIPADEQAKAAS
jgi:hypothetical protein